MENNKQIQKAGNNSQIVQANNIYINSDKNEIKVISRQVANSVFEEKTEPTLEVVKKRIDRLEKIIIERMPNDKKTISCFYDPSFQYLLKKAQLSASLTDNENDYQIITELLILRAKSESSGRLKSAIYRSIEVISQIDEKALCLLTIVYCFMKFHPMYCKCSDGLRIQNENYSKLINDNDLICNFDWIEHLDVLDIVRGNRLQNFKKFTEYCTEVYKNYSSAGIRIESLEYEKARKILIEAKLSPNQLIDNIIMSGYVILPFFVIDRSIEIEVKQKDGTTIIRKINNAEYNALKEVEKLYTKDSNINKKAGENFIKYWDTFPYLKKIHYMWDRMSYSFIITDIGKNIAYANAKLYNTSLPNLSFEDR